MPTTIAVRGADRWAFQDVPYRRIAEPTMHWEYSGADNEVNFGAVNVTFRTDDSQPRHRHHFDQIRYIIAGSMRYGRNRTAVAGDCVYFPEGVHYGPISYEEGEFFLLQWPGPSEHGMYIDYERIRSASVEMQRSGGHFDSDKGVFHHTTGRVQDGYEAIAEHILGQPIRYASGRYTDQVDMRAANFAAYDIDGAPGVRIKHLGYFNEVGPNIKLLDFDGGAELPGMTAGSQQIWTVINGQVAYDNGSYEARSILHVSPGAERRPIRAETATRMLVVHLTRPNGPLMPSTEY